MTRSESIVTAFQILKNGSMRAEEIIKTADSLYSKGGANSNLKESRYAFNHVVPALAKLGVVTVADGIYKFVPPHK